ncbi:MAG: epoxyqueuosine reductase QueH [Oscillospiraceae bacterium]|nr:epoxyqueuosine reductase QueH [Oscillospiraceae bacterium]
MQNNEKRNYSIELQKLIDKQGTVKPKLLLHACCAPCSSYVLEYISKHFDITMLYYNPNITPESEYTKRLDELKRLLKTASFCEGVRLMNCKYDPESFFEIAKGLEELPEGNERCFKCYMLRLELTAQTAKENGFDYFTTTLSISPYKNSKKLAEISLVLEEKYGVKWLPSDFKKKGGYKRSIELSKEFDLYRQDYCGCVFSKLEAERKRMNNDSSTCE